MAYYNGTANDLTALRQALVDACTGEGWSWDSGNEVLSKGTMYLLLQIPTGYLTLLGRTSASAGDAPQVVRIGQLAGTPLAWPLAYEIFVFASEVYLVVNYGVDYYQWAAFGQSTVGGLAGTGMWVGASGGYGSVSINMTSSGGGSYYNVAPALFWGTYATPGAYGSLNCYAHSDLDGHGWWMGSVVGYTFPGAAPLAPLPALLPNDWNSEAVMLPIRGYKYRPSSTISLVVDLENARHTRIDNYTPGQIITIGTESWKVFPWYLKDAANRSPGSTHTGTFGWAVRYEGP